MSLPVPMQSSTPAISSPGEPSHAPASDLPFFLAMGIIGAAYVFLIVWMLFADAARSSVSDLTAALANPDVQYSIILSLVSCSVTALLSVFVAVPIGYILSRYLVPVHPVLAYRHGPLDWSRPGSMLLRILGHFVDTILDIPIILPPLVIGLSLLILFRTAPGKFLDACFAQWAPPLATFVLLPGILLLAIIASATGLTAAFRRGSAGLLTINLRCFALLLALYATYLAAWYFPAIRSYFDTALSRGITYEIPAVILAQFMVAAAFAVRTMRITFDQIHPRREQVALTLGCSRGQAFRLVVLPEARRGILAAATLAWARALGEFGPILVFAGATRGRTEVLSTTVYLELSIGRLESAVAVSLIMVAAAVLVLIVTRVFGIRDVIHHGGAA